MNVIDAIAIGMMSLGMILYLGGVVGLLRFPDFYTRMHAAGKGDTLSSLLFLGGLAVYHLHEVIAKWGHEGWHQPVFVILKLLGISLFFMLTSPASTHALIEAGYDDGIEPKVVKDDLTEAGDS